MYSLQEIADIIKLRPNGDRIKAAQKLNKKLMRNVHGVGMKAAMKRLAYFENEDLFKCRSEYAMSNIDLFGRLLQEEERVFTTKGGSSYFHLPEQKEKEMHEILDNVCYGMSLHNWIATFGINAYRCDPMGLIFIEVEQQTNVTENEDIKTPRAYPVYKSIQTIHTYKNYGQKLEYVCFILSEDELINYGIEAPQPQSVVPLQAQRNEQYYRFVDTQHDVIVKYGTGGLNGAANCEIVKLANGLQNPIKGLWDNKVPAFIVSDIVKFPDPNSFDTPLNKVIELAETYLFDRSIKDLQKLYHGFAKAVEPLVDCNVCKGEGVLNGNTACPVCTQPGQTRGTGFKLRNTVADSFKVPMSVFEKNNASGFDFKKIFGYVTPDIESAKMQTEGLAMIEALMHITYWTQNKTQITGFNGSQKDNKGQEETATKTLSDLQGQYARLNRTADWAEYATKAAANLIGEYWFETSWKGASIHLNRNYILETPDTILQTYSDMRKTGAPDSALDSQYLKYIDAKYEANQIYALVMRKKFEVEPFPHLTAEQVEASSIVINIDKVCKRYYGEWADTLKEGEWLKPDVATLRGMLLAYATEKESKLNEQQEEETEREIKVSTAGKQVNLN
jgi:hypothetical protein